MIAFKETLKPDTWFENHYEALYLFARSRLKDEAAAKDAVQDALMAAFKARDRFQGNSNERTWLIGILRHKIVDHIRKQSRTVVVEDTSLIQEDRLETFDRKGSWRVAPAEWTVNPRTASENAEFSVILTQALEQLDEKYRKAFVLREIEGHDISEISKELGVTENNFSVILYRAKAKLRELIKQYWRTGSLDTAITA